ncbi:lipopolysaccharide biosynthesis protein [Proteiniphilum acetatigenes]|uniref:lipopolysaccharide biosynthesis protein n=1 Tax=Proteiniphilum acetatigenes TaxID=294710 RepID=UPI00036237CA|nr:lipopolysaccharide biosynthesis protein [Proteiniphilum acetatigenes]
MEKTLKEKTVNALVWNTFDKTFSQITYAVVGIILANTLFPEDFGLIHIITVFSAFLSVFIDSGFTVALIQRKNITDRDYNTIFFFNLSASIVLYLLLFFLAPLIAVWFEDARLVPLSRTMFLTVIIQAFGLVQSSILMRNMHMKAFAISNIVPLLISGTIAVILALNGYGPWALVAQALALAAVRSILLWVQNSWRPRIQFDKASFMSLYSTGKNMFLASFTGTLFQNLYPLIIGIWYSLRDLGYYSQADRWSKMGYTALGQALGQSLFPALSSIQDDPERMQRVYGKTNRTAAYLSFPFFLGLIVVATPLFHVLFGTKWDASIPLFQLLLVKGIFFVFTTLMTNYLIAQGRTKTVFHFELIKNGVILLAILLTVRISIPALVAGQAAAGLAHYVIALIITSRATQYSIKQQLKDIFPYIVIGGSVCALLMLVPMITENPYWQLVLQITAGFLIYTGINKLLRSTIQQDIFNTIANKIKNVKDLRKNDHKGNNDSTVE